MWWLKILNLEYCQRISNGNIHTSYTDYATCSAQLGFRWKVYEQGVMGGNGGYGDFRRPVEMGSRGSR